MTMMMVTHSDSRGKYRGLLRAEGDNNDDDHIDDDNDNVDNIDNHGNNNDNHNYIIMMVTRSSSRGKYRGSSRGEGDNGV